jgi:ribosomal protein L30E
MPIIITMIMARVVDVDMTMIMVKKRVLVGMTMVKRAVGVDMSTAKVMNANVKMAAVTANMSTQQKKKIVYVRMVSASARHFFIETCE